MKKPSVFVVDDEAQICALLKRILAREGYDVRAFADPHDALESIENEHPDLLVTDLMMPRMGGLELISRTKAVSPDTAAVVITGYASIDSVVDALRSGVDDFVTKPFSVAEIRDVVAAALDRSLETAEVAAGAPSAPVEQRRTGIGLPAQDAPALTRRITDMAVTERLYALLAEEAPSGDLLPRATDLLRSALDVTHALLLAPGGRDGGYRVHGSTAPPAAAGHDDGFLLAALERVAEAGVAATITSDAIEPIAALLDTGPAAAAPLPAPQRAGARAGLLVVSRRAGGPGFDAAELHRLGVAARALGDVFRARRDVEAAEAAYVDSLSAIVAATETRVPCFAHHSERVRQLSVDLGRRVGLAAPDLDVLDSAARLLDLGRVEIPDELFVKTDRLTDAEWRAIRRHVAVADDLVRPIGRLRHVKPVIRHHHENWDGSGYPDGLREQEIPYLAALVRIVDAYAALTSARSWRPALEDSAAIRKIGDLSGRHFHPDLATAFAEMPRRAAPGAGSGG